MEKALLGVLTVIFLLLFWSYSFAETCSSSGAIEYKYTASGCGYITQSRTCCSDRNWSSWDSGCKECASAKPSSSESCGNCGTRTREVTCDYATGKWQEKDWGECRGSGECAAGSTRWSRACVYSEISSRCVPGNDQCMASGNIKQVCSSSCKWGPELKDDCKSLSKMSSRVRTDFSSCDAWSGTSGSVLPSDPIRMCLTDGIDAICGALKNGGRCYAQFPNNCVQNSGYYNGCKCDATIYQCRIN